jgi:MEDS: MEthanogen/methylotroph, DcmR Sensory domain
LTQAYRFDIFSTMAKPAKCRDRSAHVVSRHDDVLAEALTGWATNLLFPIPEVPNRYLRIPWRRILETRGPIRGFLFVVRILALWPFELMIEVLSPGRNFAGGNQNKSDVSDFNYGDHVCYLYRSEDDLQDLLARYVNEGLRRGEQCVCVETMRVQERLCRDLRSLGIDPEKEIAKGSLLFLSEEEVYFKSGEFDAEGLLNQLAESINLALIGGFSGFRIAGEISAASGNSTIQKKVIDYERRVDK